MNYFVKIITVLCLSIGSYAYGQTITIPNVFTPNNDGVNDFFRVSAKGYNELTCTIFNRYGSTVYKFEGLNGSWDGFTHAGEKVTPGVYWVHIEAVDAAGEVTKKQSVLTVTSY